ncbi:MAG: acetate--CoA ligase family protein [bacterium]
MLLDFEKTKGLLEKYQIPMVESLVVKNLEQGIEFADRVGFPVVLKLLLPDALHKIDKGLVKLNIQNEQELRAALGELPRGLPSGELFIQKQISGTELFVGIKKDKSFGPVISFGLGGIFVEVLGDIVFAICPISKNEAMEMIKKIKGYKILQGYRNQPGVDVGKLADILVNISELAVENQDIQEIDFNPVMASGSEIFIVDPKIT